MTNREKLAQMSTEELSKIICNAIGGCDFCKFSKECFASNVCGKGLTNWLEAEVEENNV